MLIPENSMSTFTAVLHKEDDTYVAECPEVGTTSQGRTVEEAVSNLKEATGLYLEEFPGTKKKRAILTTCHRLPHHKPVSGEETIRILCNKFDFSVSGHAGSHVRLSKSTTEGKIGTVVPLHDELKPGTL
jgi:predicted RNase H-like HicB family nuclease